MQLNTSTNIIGNSYDSDNSYGFKEEVKEVFESYTSNGVNLATNDLEKVISGESSRQEFVDNVLESVTSSPIFTDATCANTEFYNNYSERAGQLIDNSLKTVATESAMIGYAPIVAYNPFFIKKQWIECIFKDVLMTEVPKTPVINIGFEKRYIRTQEGTEYPLPESLYDDKIMKELYSQATGLSVKEDYLDIALFKPALKLVDPTYIPGVIKDDPSVELTPGIHVCKVQMTDSDTAKAYDVPCNIKIDITTHQFVKGAVHYNVKDENGEVTKVLEDELLGTINFDNSSVTLMSTTGVVTKVSLRGKIANRFNERAVSVRRKNEQQQFTMPESGPRLDTAVTVEDAADALATQKIDVIADNIDTMGKTLANFEDTEILSFLRDSFDTQEKAGVGPHGYDAMTVKASFNAIPYDGYTANISKWMEDAREYFERVIAGLKTKLKTPNAIIVVVCNPNIIRFLQGGIKWVFTDDTQISGMKIAYNFGMYTTASDRVHVITTMRMPEDEGLRFIVIPQTKELITFKHYKYNTVIDRNYRNPMYRLTPNIMCTHRTLTIEILPVQGQMLVKGRDLFSPESLKRATTTTTTPVDGGGTEA